jgi:hypothetical protein
VSTSLESNCDTTFGIVLNGRAEARYPPGLVSEKTTAELDSSTTEGAEVDDGLLGLA